MMKNKNRPERKFTAIAKVGYDKSIQKNICVKYRTNKPENVIAFLQKKFPSVCWINIFHRIGDRKNMLAYTWGKNKGLQPAH